MLTIWKLLMFMSRTVALRLWSLISRYFSILLLINWIESITGCLVRFWKIVFCFLMMKMSLKSMKSLSKQKKKKLFYYCSFFLLLPAFFIIFLWFYECLNSFDCMTGWWWCKSAGCHGKICHARLVSKWCSHFLNYKSQKKGCTLNLWEDSFVYAIRHYELYFSLISFTSFIPDISFYILNARVRLILVFCMYNILLFSYTLMNEIFGFVVLK